MNTLDKFKSRFGPAQTDHKRLAEIKLTQERLNKKPAPKSTKLLTKQELMRNVKTSFSKSDLKPRGGAGALALVGGVVGGLRAGAFNLAKNSKPFTIPEIIEPVLEFMEHGVVEDYTEGPGQTVRAADTKTKNK